jgi:hypothetical protein
VTRMAGALPFGSLIDRYSSNQSRASRATTSSATDPSKRWVAPRTTARWCRKWRPMG